MIERYLYYSWNPFSPLSHHIKVNNKMSMTYNTLKEDDFVDSNLQN